MIHLIATPPKEPSLRFLLNLECDGQCFDFHAHHRPCSAPVCVSWERHQRAVRIGRAFDVRKHEIAETGQ